MHADQIDQGATEPRSPHQPRRRYPKGELRRQQILDRTVEVFAELGFENTSLRAIGEAIGVSHAALRRYFDTREELFLEVLREKDRQALAEALEHELLPVDLASGLEAYAAGAPGLMALRHSMVARAMEPDNELSRAFFTDRYRSLRGEAAHTLALGRAAGTVRGDLPLEVLASLVIAAMDGLSTQWLLEPEVPMLDGMHALEQLLRPPGSATS